MQNADLILNIVLSWGAGLFLAVAFLALYRRSDDSRGRRVDAWLERAQRRIGAARMVYIAMGVLFLTPADNVIGLALALSSVCLSVSPALLRWILGPSPAIRQVRNRDTRR